MPLEWNVSIFNNCTDHYRISVQKNQKSYKIKNQFSVLWSSTVSMSFKSITPAWQQTIGRVVHSAALRARSAALRSHASTALSLRIRRNCGHRRHHIRAGNVGNIRPGAAAACRPDELRPWPPSAFIALPSIVAAGGGVEGGLMEAKGGGRFFKVSHF